MIVIGLAFIIVSCAVGLSFFLFLLMFPAMIIGSATRELTEKPRKRYKEIREEQKMKNPMYRENLTINEVANKHMPSYISGKLNRKVQIENGKYVVYLDTFDDTPERQAYSKAMKELGIKNYSIKKP